MTPFIRHLFLFLCLVLCASAVHAGPPDRPPCQGDDRDAGFTGYQTSTRGPLHDVLDDPQPIPECTVIRGCESDAIDLFKIPPGTSSSMAPINYEYHAQVTLDPDDSLGQNPYSYRQTELMRMTADLVSEDDVLARDVVVMVAHQRWHQGQYELLFEMLDPVPTSVVHGDPPPGGNGAPVVSYSFRTKPTKEVSVGETGENQHFFFRIKNNRSLLVIVAWDENETVQRSKIPFPDLPGAQFENVTLTLNHSGNNCGALPQVFKSDHFLEDGAYWVQRINP